MLAEDSNLVGVTIGAYRIASPIGAGGMGAVYLAEQAPLGRPVALKVIHDRLAQDPAVAARFLREAKIASSLRNPNTVTIYDFGQSADGRLYMAMELLEGESLAGRLERQGALTADEAVVIGTQICRSLAEAHGKAIVHRDLKSDNVFLTTADDGSLLVKVLDYGIAHAGAASAAGAAPGETLTQHGMVVGTPSYMSPEQARAEPVDGRADLYALGVILFEMLTGRRPFVGENPIVVLGKVITELAPQLSTVGVHAPVPPALEELVLSLLEKDRALRPPSALVVQARLRSALGAARPAAAPAAPPVQGSLGGGWGLPVELGGGRGPAMDQATVSVRATPPAAASPPPQAATPARPSRPPPVVIEADASPFEHDAAPMRLEVDRTAPSDLGVPLALRRRSSLPPRQRVSQPSAAARAEPRTGMTWVVVVFVLGVAGAAVWAVTRPGAGIPLLDAPAAPDAGERPPPPAPAAAVPEELPLSRAAVAREEESLRAGGFGPAELPPGRWSGTYDLDGGTLRLFEEAGRVTGTFESALRAGRIEGALAPGGILEFDWRSRDTGAVRGAEVRSGKGVLRSWVRRRDRRLLGTWGFSDQREGALWLAVPRGAGLRDGKRPRR